MYIYIYILKEQIVIFLFCSYLLKELLYSCNQCAKKDKVYLW